MNGGIYLIRNTITGKVYIGSSINIAVRWRHHINGLKAGRHKTPHLQSSWNQYGEAAFSFEVLKRCDPTELLVEEQRFIDQYKAADREFGYNTSPVAGTCLGVKRTPEARAKMSAAKIGEKHPNYGKPLPDSTRKKIGKANSGRKHTEESKEKNRQAHIGRKHTPESLAKISAGSAGSNNRMYGKRGSLSPRYGKPCSLETRNKISKANSGKVRTAECKAKLSAYSGEKSSQYGKRGNLCHNFGRVLSEEHKAKIRDGVKARWAFKRGDFNGHAKDGVSKAN